MGDLSNAMRNLVDDIKSSAENRRVSTENRYIKISEMRSDTHNLMERFHLERQDLANALREKLSSDEAARKEAIQKLMGDVREFMENAGSDLRDMADAMRERLSSDEAVRKEAAQRLLNDVRYFMNDVRSELQDMASALREKLSSDEQARRETIQQLLDELRSDLHEAREVWETLLEGTSPQPATEEETMPEPVAEESAEPSPEDAVLEVIAKHSEGIRLVEIGNEMGVDWRGLIGVVKPLVDEDRIEKIDNLYYPKN